ncbi:MAG: DUF1653 domain-containing protein [bacterium]|nr:DUF1653 domain-containing protein [bacterium]
MKAPANVPEKGFYYHYKHDPHGLINNYAYEVVGVGFHTENDCRPIDTHMVIYQPIYESTVFTLGKFFDIRPLEMFAENVTKESKTFPRFKKITDPNVIAQLEKIKAKMYS